MIAAVVQDMDDVDIVYVLGPYTDAVLAEANAQYLVDTLTNSVEPGHARPHEWDYVIMHTKTLQEVMNARQ
jgi:hypothetical protein